MADLTLKFRNDFDELSVAMDTVTRFLEREKASPEVTFAANLGIEEIVTNAITYGYEDTLTHEITVRLTVGQGALEIQICDDGREFDPFAQSQPALQPARPVGGLGIHLVRNMLDACVYERRGEHNIIKLTKKLTDSARKGSGPRRL